MSIELKEIGDQAGQFSILLTGQLDFDTASSALELVAPHIGGHPQLLVDLAGITAANSAGLALLAEWKALAHRSDTSVKFSNVPESLARIAGICQVESLLS